MTGRSQSGSETSASLCTEISECESSQKQAEVDPEVPSHSQSCMDTETEKSIETDTEISDSSVTGDAEMTDQCNSLNDFPTELILEIMQNLDYGDLLTARLVCQRWNIAISGWIGFTDRVIVRLHRNSQVLDKSVVSWKSLVFCNFTKEDVPMYLNIPACSDESLTSLVLSDGTLNWNFFTDIGARFPNLIKLSIVKCELENWSSRNGDQSPDSKRLIQRIKSLNLEVDLIDLNLYFEEFYSDFSTLENLEITVVTKSKDNQDARNFLPYNSSSRYEEFHKFTNGLKNMLVSNSSSLKTLNIKIGYRMGEYVGRCFHILDESKVKFDLNEFRLEWNVDFHNRFDFELLRQTERLLKSFLRTQTNLTCLYLPRLEKNITADHGLSDFLNVIPNGLRELGTGQLSMVSRELFQTLPELKVMKIDFPSSLLPTSPVAYHISGAISDNVNPQMESVSLSGNPLSNLVPSIIYGFPNLLKLEIVCSTGKSSVLMINDQNLQLIIQHLPHLQVLKLDSGHLVTDFGISGIWSQDSRTLLESNRSWYMEEDLAHFGIKKKGLSLCSLKYLKEFSLVGSYCHISDVGIHYGFAFEDLRKLGIVCDEQISHWGLIRLATLNPNLERCEFGSSSVKLQESRASFLQLLPRLNTHTLRLSFAGSE